MKTVFISLVNYNGSENTQACLDSIDKLVVKDLQLYVVVVDNNSSEELKLKNDYKQFTVKKIDNKVNLGFGGGHNVGIVHALNNKADYVMVLNNDTILDKHVLIRLFSEMEGNSKVGIASPKIYFAPGFEFHKERYGKEDRGKVIWYAGGIMDWENIFGRHRGVDEVDIGQFEKVTETEFTTGCCMMIRKEAFQTVGLFDEDYFLYYEDSDLNERIKRADFKALFVPEALLWHKNAQSTGGSGSALQDYYITRNRLLFASHYATTRTKAALIRESVAILLNGRKWQKRGIVDYYIGRRGRGSFRP